MCGTPKDNSIFAPGSQFQLSWANNEYKTCIPGCDQCLLDIGRHEDAKNSTWSCFEQENLLPIHYTLSNLIKF